MQFCKPHWTALRTAIEEKGMGALIAKSGEAVIANVELEIQGGNAAFDPLMAAHNMILSRALDGFGLALLAPDENGGHYCPLCETEVHTIPGAPACRHPGQAADWIKGCTDFVQKTCREKGLIPEAH